MIEQKFNASLARVYDLLTDAQWLEQRCLDLGELAATVKVKKTSKGASVTMKRRIKRDVPALVAKVLKPEGDMHIDESWSPDDDDGHSGSLSLDIVGQPIKISAEFSLRASGKGCVFTIQHTAKCGVPLIGGAVEKFALSQVEKGCADELAYVVKHLKKHA